MLLYAAFFLCQTICITALDTCRLVRKVSLSTKRPAGNLFMVCARTRAVEIYRTGVVTTTVCPDCVCIRFRSFYSLVQL